LIAALSVRCQRQEDVFNNIAEFCLQQLNLLESSTKLLSSKIAAGEQY
jgi:hypothetical protein